MLRSELAVRQQVLRQIGPMQWWINLLSPFAAGLLVAGAAAWLAQLGLERRKPPRGWRKVGPGPMLTAAVLGCAALAGLMAYVRLFVGSARADAEQQMLILTFLVAAFAAGAIYSCVIVRKVLKRDLRWQSGRLNYADASGQRVTRQFSEVAGIDPRPFRDLDCRLWFADGTWLDVASIAGNARDMLEAIALSLEERSSRGQLGQ
jgi:hypothetical protein